MDNSISREEIEAIEKELLDEIVKNMEQNKITMNDAEQAAKDFLALLPILDKKDLLEKLKRFAQDHYEGQGVFLKYVKPFEEEERLRKLDAMAGHIKKGNIQEALSVAKGGIV